MIRLVSGLVLPMLMALGGCMNGPFIVPEHLSSTPPSASAVTPDESADATKVLRAESQKLPVLEISNWSGDSDSKWQKLDLSNKTTNLNVESLPLNQFIQVALGDVLGLTFIVDPAVQAREDPVTLRVSKPIPEKKMLDTVEQILAGYEVGLSFERGTLEVLPSAKLEKLAPTFVGPRARFAMQQGKIMSIIPLLYSNPEETLRFARYFVTLGPNASVDILRRLNAVMVIGDASQVARFRSVVEMVDQPSMAGRKIQIIRPTYWQAGEIIDLLKDALKIQGILIAESADSSGVYLSEIKQLNSLMVASPDNSVVSWIEDWIKALDTPDVAGDSLRSFVYPVKHSTAAELGQVVAEVLGGFNNEDDAVSKPDSRSSGATSANIPVSTGSSLKMVIDEPHNSLVFVGSAQSYKAVYQLLEQVDMPAKQVLLEVTVADLTLEANTQLGIEWQFNDSHGDFDGVGGTQGGLGIGGGGFTYSAFDDVGNLRARINALATKGDAQILSSPRLLAVDNEEARIQVGTQIAVITSENTSDSVDGIIRSFSYVDTGVILSFTPTVMAGGQVRLKVSQEVSVPGASLNNTPPINTRSVQTTLIAQSGSTIMIGGLISSTDTVSDSQLPGFGDIPIFGALFRAREVVDNSTEMVVLITPHIIESSAQLESLTEAFRAQIEW